MAPRKYEQRKRAEQAAETRRRIVAATVELHRTVGPAATQVSEIAARAGVQRVTVYSHFPDEAALLVACSAHWRALHPAPEPAAWLAVADPAERRRAALRDIYGWYRQTEAMTANVLRDAELKPALGRVLAGGRGRYLETVHRILAETTGARGARRKRVDAAVTAALDFHFWRALAPLGDDDAADLAAGLIELAATGAPYGAPKRARAGGARRGRGAD